MKAFLILGTQKFQFDRLLKAADAFAEKHPDYEIFAQTGGSTYEPKHMESQHFIDRDEFASRLDDADVIITHGGTGAIIGALKKHKKIMAVPRKREYGEHVDDHQEQLVNAFEKAGYICGCSDMEEFEATLFKTIQMEPVEFKSNTECFAKHVREELN